MKKKIQQIGDYLIRKYEWLLAQLLKIRLVRVDREAYVHRMVLVACRRNGLRTNGEEYATMVETALSSSLSEVVDEDIREKEYRRLLWRYGSVVFMVSFVLTLVPDDMVWVVVSGALDLAIFQCVLFLAMQKILLLYGSKEALEMDETKNVETLISIDSSGLMIGKHPILQKMKSVVGWLGKQVVRRMGPEVVAKASRSVFIVLRRQSVKWLSIVIAKEHVDIVFNALIPLTCAVISGLVSVVIFVPMCNKLRRSLL